MKMTAAVMYEQGLPRPFAQSLPLRIERVDLEGPGEGEVLVRIVGAGLCHSDLSAMKGNRPRALPAVVGHEAAGIVQEVGSGVKRFTAGDHVVMLFVASCGVCKYCTSGRPNLCQSSWKSRAEGTLQSGARRLSVNGKPVNHWSGISAFAEYAVVSERSIIKIPKAVPLMDAAIFGCAVITGAGAVMNAAGSVRDKTIAVVGLGGVGLSGLLGGVVQGASRIIAVDMSEQKLALARELGATHTFLASDSDCIAKIRELTDGGADVVFEMAGSVAATKSAYEMGSRGSTLVCVGLPPATATFAFGAAAMVADERVIKGSYMGSSDPSRDIPILVGMFLEGKLAIGRLRSDEIGFDDLNSAFDRLDDGQGVRQVLKCSA
jgi:alcohol dehydrogenase